MAKRITDKMRLDWLQRIKPGLYFAAFGIVVIEGFEADTIGLRRSIDRAMRGK